MTKAGKGIFKTVLLSGVAAFALAASPLSVSQFASSGDFVAQAFAADDGEAKGSKQYRGGGSSKGQGGSGGQAGQGGSGGSGGSGGGHVPDAVTTSDDGDDEAKGPKYKGGGAGSGGSDGGKPVWAQEGIPEVELGRLNVARAPEHVLIRQLDEALASFTPEMADFYNLSLAEMIAVLSDPVQFDALSRLDSPLMNLALYKEVVLNLGDTSLPGVNSDLDKLSALFIGTASDKVVSLSEDSITALNAILGLPELTPAETAALAAAAESIREAIESGHE